MTHASAVAYFVPPPRFEDLSQALHQVVASYLPAHEALAMGATQHGLETFYSANITQLTVRPQLLNDYGPKKRTLNAHDWEAYLTRHGSSLARLFARLPSLAVLKGCIWQWEVISQAIFLQPCPQLTSIGSSMRADHSCGSDCQRAPEGSHLEGPSLLLLAMVKGHLPSLEELDVPPGDNLPIIVEAVRAGHLKGIKGLNIIGHNRQPLSPLRSLLEAFEAQETKLEAIESVINWLSDKFSQYLLRELISSPVFSNLRKLTVMSACDDPFASAVAFVSNYLKGAGAGGWPFLRELHFWVLGPTEDISCLGDAFLHGGGSGSAPNLEKISFSHVHNGILARLGSHLFARGAMAILTTLSFSNVHFNGESMADLVDGFRRSGHEGRTLKKLDFEACNLSRIIGEPGLIIEDFHYEISLALIEGFEDGLFPNLEELLTPGGAVLVAGIEELAEVLEGGAPCAHTLRTVVMSKEFLEPADIEELQAVLPLATVSLE